MKYINIKTGAIIDSSSNFIGTAWKPLDEQGKQPKQETEEQEIDLEKMTKAQLLDFAKEHEVEVSDKDTKADIIQTIAKAFE